MNWCTGAKYFLLNRWGRVGITRKRKYSTGQLNIFLMILSSTDFRNRIRWVKQTLVTEISLIVQDAITWKTTGHNERGKWFFWYSHAICSMKHSCRICVQTSETFLFKYIFSMNFYTSLKSSLNTWIVFSVTF